MDLGYTFTACFAMLLSFFTGIRSGKGNPVGFEDHKFNTLTRWIVFYCALDAVWGAFFSGYLHWTAGFNVLSYAVYLVSGIVTMYWFFYMVDYLGAGPIVNIILRSIAIILLIFLGMILISNAFTHDVFFINSEGAYHYSTGRIQLQIIQSVNYALFTVYGLFRLIFGGKAGRGKYLSGVIYALVPGLFGLGQMFFIGVSMYSLGFSLIIYIMFVFDKTNSIMNFIEQQRKQEREEQLSIISGLAGNFSTVYSIDLNTGGFIVYNRTGDESFLKKGDNSNLDYFKTALEKGRRMVHEDDMEAFLLAMDRERIKRRLEREDSFSLILRIRFGNDIKYFEYRFTLNKTGAKQRAVIAVYDIDKAYRKKLRDAQTLTNAKQRQSELEEEAQLLDKAAHRDIMTGLFNRRAYEAYAAECRGMPDGDDFVYASLDVNGLKAVNDDLGHEAGDELIKGAAFCMKKALGDYGLIYRHGGDEFSAVLHAPENKLAEIFKKFDNTLEEYQGKLIKEISVSYGYVSVADAGMIPIEEMIKIADKRMYEAKSLHYARKGIDRRGQQDAYNAIRKSYIKILKVDLKEDTFATVYMGDNESQENTGYNDSISKWLLDFATLGNIHPEDSAEFIKIMDIDSVRKHFSEGHENIALHYRRKSGDGYGNALLELIPSENFSPENQTVFLYVKNIY